MTTEGVKRALRAAVELVNTMPEVGGEEGLLGLDTVRDLMRRYLITYPRPIADRDLEALREGRAGLRAFFESGSAEAGAAQINALLPLSPFSPLLANHDGLGWHMHYFPEEASLADRLYGDLVMASALLLIEGEWSRLGRCGRDGCERVFFDETRNRSRQFCDSPACGNQIHVAAYRARQRQQKLKPGVERSVRAVPTKNHIRK